MKKFIFVWTLLSLYSSHAWAHDAGCPSGQVWDEGTRVCTGLMTNTVIVR